MSSVAGDIIREIDNAGKPFRSQLRYSFLLKGAKHDVQLEHQHGVWRVLVDGDLVLTKKHNKSNPLTSARHHMEFEVKVGPAKYGNVPAILKATWIIKKGFWRYDLSVNGKNVTAAWSKRLGDASAESLEVFGDDTHEYDDDLEPPIFHAPCPEAKHHLVKDHIPTLDEQALELLELMSLSTEAPSSHVYCNDDCG